MDMLGAFIIGLISAFIGSISTGANLISIPGLIFMGVSPVGAIATTRLSAVSGGLSVVYRYNKGKAVLWRYIPHFLIIAVAAGIIGPLLLLKIHENSIKPIIGALLILTLPLFLWKRNFGTAEKRTSSAHKAIGMALMFIILTYSSMFTLGGGVFMIYVLVYFFGMTVIEANATGTAIWVLTAATALIAYASEGEVVWSVGIPLLIGAAIGGSLGAQLALKKGAAWVKWLLAIVILASGLKLILS